MKTIAIISSSVREGRLSHALALYLEKYLAEKFSQEKIKIHLLDLKAYNFPLFEERLAFQKNPAPELLDFTNRFNESEMLFVVSPVYNSSFPASLKNVIDLYYKEWQGKKVAVCVGTSGKVPPYDTAVELRNLLSKLGAEVIPVMPLITELGVSISAEGIPQNPDDFFKMFCKVV